MKDPIIVSEDFHEILDQLELNRDHIFVTGKAGTGKSTLLQLFKKTTKKKCIVLAPTGVAALNVGGVTIHSFFGFAPRLLTSKDIEKRKNQKLFKSIDVIIIDEISMVRADQLDNIDYALRLNRNSNELFGGVQMLFFGDLFQLPPVVATPFERNYFQTVYESPYFFSAKVFEQGFEMETFELRTVYRQEEKRFVSLLESIRSRDIDQDVLEDRNSRVMEELPRDEGHITLTARNNVAQAINKEALEKIDEQKYLFAAKVSGQFRQAFFPTDEILALKKGAQVMFIKNDSLRRFVNGTVGTIIDLDANEIKVQIQRKNKLEVVAVEKHEWEILKYTTASEEIKAESIGAFVQFPLRLAWAITIHKSQGKTFDRVIIDMGGGAFEHGQTYVALSRCRTLEGIILKKPIRYRDVLVDERIVDFHQRLRW